MDSLKCERVHENKVKDAYNAGLTDGQENRFEPPQWMRGQPEKILWMVAYENGFNAGLALRRAEKGNEKHGHV